MTPLARTRAPLARLGQAALDLVLPPRCLSCGAQTGSPGLCPPCWRGLSFIDGAQCAACGLPFDLPIGAGNLCGPCLARPPAFERARAALVYDEASAALILPLKHGDRLDGAPIYGAWMARAGARLIAEAEVITAVPLHRWRLLRRRYNQAAVLALAIATDRAARGLGAPQVVPDLIRRVRATPSQAGLDASARRANLRGAFAPHPGRRAQIAGRGVLVIDDVMTTGATAEAMARALKGAGASAVDILALAQVARPALI